MTFDFKETEVCNFADDFKETTLKLCNGTHLILNWFRINSMVANPGKFQIMFLESNIDNSKNYIYNRK